MSLLTLKHVENSGHESLQLAHSVCYTPKKAAAPDDPNPVDVLVAFGCTMRGGAVDEYGVCRYGSGVVYVMNDSGSTVGQYWLN